MKKIDLCAIAITTILGASAAVLPLTAATATTVTGASAVSAADTSTTADTSVSTNDTTTTVPGSYIVTYAGGETPTKKEVAADTTEALSGTDGDVDVTSTKKVAPNIATVQLDSDLSSSDEADFVSSLEAQPQVVAVEPNQILHAQTTSDTYYSSLWNINNQSTSTYGVDAEDAWSTATGSGVVIAVLDTGITLHSDLADNILMADSTTPYGYDFVTNSPSGGVDSNDGDSWDSDPTDPGDYGYCQQSNGSYADEDSSWHGTHVAGIAAAVEGNSKGVAGVAPRASIEAVRVLGGCGGSTSDIIAGITWAAGLPVNGVTINTHPADVINMSLGGTGACSTAMQAAITDANDAGTLVVAAAGNSAAALSTTTPANCAKVIRVTASTYTGSVAYYSNYGTSSAAATIAAPGGSAVGTSTTRRIYSTVNTGTTTAVAESYDYMAGTSMAAPHVTGIIALLTQLAKAAGTTLSYATATTLLQDTATSFASGATYNSTTSCTTVACGPGIANASKAVSTYAAELGVGTSSASASSSSSPSASASSSASASTPTVSVTPSVSLTTTPVVSGTRKVGKTLRTSTGTWSTSATISYRWYRNGTAISGATASTYTLKAADKGTTISVKVTASKTGYTSGNRTVTAGTIAAGTITKVTTPKTSGTARVGRKLRVTSGTWKPSATITYRWYRNGKAIPGATKASYHLTAKDKGTKITVRVTAQKAGYTSVQVIKTAAARVKSGS